MRRKLSFALVWIILLAALAACAAPQPVEAPPLTQPPAQATDEAPPAAADEPAAPETAVPTRRAATQPPSAAPLPGLLPAGPLALVTLGDSLTEGQGDSDSGGYPARLLSRLQAVRPGSQLVNLGHSGWSSDDLIAGLQDTPGELPQAVEALKAARAAGQPGLALVWIGSNDLWYLYEYGPDPITAEAETEDLARYRKNIDQILASLRQAGAQVLVALHDDQSRRPVAAAPADPANRAFPGTSAADLGRMSAQVKAYNAILREAAARHGAGLVDFYATDIFTNPATLAEDGNHPNAQGYDRVAATWWQAVQALLKP